MLGHFEKRNCLNITKIIENLQHDPANYLFRCLQNPVISIKNADEMKQRWRGEKWCGYGWNNLLLKLNIFAKKEFKTKDKCSQMGQTTVMNIDDQ